MLDERFLWYKKQNGVMEDNDRWNLFFLGLFLFFPIDVVTTTYGSIKYGTQFETNVIMKSVLELGWGPYFLINILGIVVCTMIFYVAMSQKDKKQRYKDFINMWLVLLISSGLLLSFQNILAVLFRTNIIEFISNLH